MSPWIKVGELELPTDAQVEGLIEAQKGAAEGIAQLGTDGRVPDAELPTRLGETELSATIGAAVAEGAASLVPRAAMKFASKRATMGSGGQGTGSTQTIGTAGGTIRVPLKLPVAPKRVRVKVRNRNTISQVAGPAATGKGITIGLSAVPGGQDYESGLFSGNTSTPLESADFAIPTDGSWHVTPWLDTADLALPANREIMVAVAFVANADGSVFPRGTGRTFWFSGNTTTGLNSSVAISSDLGSCPLDVALEYEFDGDQRIGLFVGDSITEGVGGKFDEANPNGAQPTYRSWPALFAARAHCISLDIALSGTTAGQWADAAFDRWSRYDIITSVPDFAYVGFGSNDANALVTLADYKAALRSVVGNVRNKIGADKPIYVGTVLPRNFGTNAEALRQAYNAWLRTMPLRIAGVLDFDKVIRDPAAPATVLPEFFNSDNTHPSRAGYNAMAMSVPVLAGP